MWRVWGLPLVSYLIKVTPYPDAFLKFSPKKKKTRTNKKQTANQNKTLKQPEKCPNISGLPVKH